MCNQNNISICYHYKKNYGDNLNFFPYFYTLVSIEMSHVSHAQQPRVTGSLLHWTG